MLAWKATAEWIAAGLVLFVVARPTLFFLFQKILDAKLFLFLSKNCTRKEKSAIGYHLVPVA